MKNYLFLNYRFMLSRLAECKIKKISVIFNVENRFFSLRKVDLQKAF